MPALRITTLAAACLLGALSPLGQPASALATASGQNRLEPGGKASCLNLPISSIEMQPTSCWVTSPTSSVVAGTNSHNAQDGVIYVIQDQQRRRLDLPRAGRLTITGVTNRTACLRDASGGLVGVDLVSGAVGSCAAPAGRSQPAASAEVIPQVNAAAAAPPPTTSYYVYAAYLPQCGSAATTTCPLYQDGANASNAGLAILDFGAPCYNPNTLVYGTQLFNSRSCTADSDLIPLAQAWIRGYTSTHPTTATTLGLGTSNSLTGADPPTFALTPAQMSLSGSSWYGNLVHPIASGTIPSITIWAADDIEQSSGGDWYDAATTRPWVDGYQAATGLTGTNSCVSSTPDLMANYGDYVASAPGWTPNDVYYVSWGARAACAVPEIYFSANATSWASLNDWATSHNLPKIQFSGVMSEDGPGTPQNPLLPAADSWSALANATGQSPQYLTILSNAGPGSTLGAPTGVKAVPGGASATVSWSAPALDGNAHISGYTITPYIGSTPQVPTTVSGYPAPITGIVSGLSNGTTYTFTVMATNANGPGPASSPSNPVMPSDAFPYTAVSRQQYQLTASDGITWSDLDPTNLSLRITPSSDVTAVLSANADLWTANAGINQDLGIDVNGTVLVWKESGGFGGTFSPNAAFVQATMPMTHGATYVIKLRWKTNKPEGTATIFAGAGAGAPFSPTRLTVQLATGATVNAVSSDHQYLLPATDGSAWVPIDGISLSETVTATGAQTAVIGGNADLWTVARGYNQDIGISVDGGAPIAWKESGGFAGTFSPNAAFVYAATTMTPGSHTVALVWKANKPAPVNTIVAGAGPAAPHSLTTLTVQWLPSANVVDKVTPGQYVMAGSDGSSWSVIDAGALTATITPTGNCLVVLGANADLWTTAGGVNQDVAISVTPSDAVTYPGQIAGWKESGGFAGTFSPNAAFLQSTFAMVAGTTYSVALDWKTNISSSNAARAGAGPAAPFSPTRLTALLYCG